MPSNTNPYSPTSSDRNEPAPAGAPAPSLAPGGTLVPAGRFAAAPAPRAAPTFQLLRGEARRVERRRPPVALHVCAPDDDTCDTVRLPPSRRLAERPSLVVSRRTGVPSQPPEPRGCA